MTIKHHIILSTVVSLTIIAVIACQQKTQTPEKQDKKISNVSSMVEKSTKEAENIGQEVKSETEKVQDKVNESVEKAKEEVKEIESKVEEVTDKVESEVETIENKSEEMTESEEDKGPKNLFVNGDFNDGFSEWSHDKDVSIVEVDGKKCVECIAPADIKEQTRIWQTINTTSGHVYKLSFKVKSEKVGAFAIFRDHQNNKEQYLFADASEEWKEYQENFKSTKDGEYKVFLSCQGKGKYYFSDASIIDASLEQE